MSHVGTCRHISAHVGMSKCADTCQHADKLQRVRIRDAESDGTCWHMSAHISTCRHISAHVGKSKCADTCQHEGKVQMIGITGAESDVICRHISAHVGTYQHMSACPHVLTHTSMEVRSKWLVSEGPRMMSYVGTCRHMSAHISTCRHVHMC